MRGAWVQCRDRWSRRCVRDERREWDERTWWPGLDARGSEHRGEWRVCVCRKWRRNCIKQRVFVCGKQQRWGDGV